MRFVLDMIAVCAVALFLGLGSAWLMVDRGSALTTGSFGPWSVWYDAGNPDADPYTRAHLVRSGRLPITSTSALYFTARQDGNGSGLEADCDYVLEGGPLDAKWWSLALYDGTGSLIANPLKRYAFNSSNAVRRSDGSFEIQLARKVKTGNWLPTGDDDDRDLILVLRLYGPGTKAATAAGEDPRIFNRLPAITRTDCR